MLHATADDATTNAAATTTDAAAIAADERLQSQQSPLGKPLGKGSLQRKVWRLRQAFDSMLEALEDAASARADDGGATILSIQLPASAANASPQSFSLGLGETILPPQPNRAALLRALRPMVAGEGSGALAGGDVGKGGAVGSMSRRPESPTCSSMSMLEAAGIHSASAMRAVARVAVEEGAVLV